ncbi:hypothetical protein [Brevundimonas sp. SORGH_AS_0993]|uniref:hypothetical protein n=1 Tax=Brevundimonas sp. SORGH_AS_0993 TaxID=3041794 RepID=UPI0027882080|nr:hypothetical protein [Brevundimonas sp. SORGH_AS_0993]MDQ1155484.1 hypothetical protein [Brevundimonas sp. SORGH_AS_0993]
MYSTAKGAKACAKTLKSLFDRSGLLYPLNRCQTAVARAGGFRDWHDMEASLATGERPVEQTAYRRRLLAALPFACHAPVRADWDGWTECDDEIDPDIPRRWFRDVFPYHFGTGVLHRSSTPLLRPGSGVGQRLRLEIVETVLSSRVLGYPSMDPETLDFVYDSDLATLFDDLVEHAHFPREFERLQQAGIVSWAETDLSGNGVLRIHPPEGLQDKVFDSAISLAEYEASGGEPRDESYGALREALNLIGISDATRIAKAISEQGPAAYVSPSGPVSSVLSDLARDGEIESFALAVQLFTGIHPDQGAWVRTQAPAKILDYWSGPRGLDQARIARWTRAQPDWEDGLRAALDDPQAFAVTVERMAQAMPEAPRVNG